MGRIISAKLKRFRSKCNSITKAGDTFELITQPREQVEVIIQEVMDFLKTWIGATLDQCDIVVFHKEQDEKWKYFASANPAWQRSDADSIFTKNSIAKFCVETGEYHFFPEKRLAAKTRLYHLSERDNRTDRGSVFCMPITNTFEGWSDHYLILLSTFGVRLCEPDDEKMVKVSKEILKEIFKRVELELLLNSD